MLKQPNIARGLGLVAIFFFISCATYYKQRESFQTDFETGNIEGAQKFLKHHTKASEKKDRLLYYMDRGVVEQMLGNYDTSNYFFEQAYYYSQDFRRNIGADIASMVTNPMTKPYKGEDYEIVMIHYYKTINYIQLGRLDDALIEVRRINIHLNEQSDKYEGKRYRYKEDAFAHLLMGTIYEAKRDFNNAFIAYRNSYNVYKDVYSELGISPPEQLKKDILRTAALTGFYSEVDLYEKEFEMKAEVPSDTSGSLVFFWLNGLVPVKGEVSVNLYNTGGNGSGFVFADDQSGMSFPVIVSNSNDKSNVSDLKMIRFTMPKFNRRDPLSTSAYLLNDSQKYTLEEAEDVSKIAIANLEDRVLKDIALSIGRLVIKQAAEAAAREQNEGIGAAVSVLNALTEKADTRNWQTLPNKINYKRVYLDPGYQEVKLINNYPNAPSDTAIFDLEVQKGRTTFQTYHTLASTQLVK